jgi:hypothetical protein
MLRGDKQIYILCTIGAFDLRVVSRESRIREKEPVVLGPWHKRKVELPVQDLPDFEAGSQGVYVEPDVIGLGTDMLKLCTSPFQYPQEAGWVDTAGYTGRKVTITWGD